MEWMLADRFDSCGIRPTAASNNYTVGSTTRDCDLVLESDEAIVLIELKKNAPDSAELWRKPTNCMRRPMTDTIPR